MSSKIDGNEEYITRMGRKDTGTVETAYTSRPRLNREVCRCRGGVSFLSLPAARPPLVNHLGSELQEVCNHMSRVTAATRLGEHLPCTLILERRVVVFLSSKGLERTESPPFLTSPPSATQISM